MSVRILTGEALNVLRDLEARSFDAVITDPPYNVGLEYDADPTHDRVDPAVHDRRMREIITECARISRDAVVLFPGTVNLFAVPRWLEGTGLRVVHPLGWHRREFAGDIYPNNRPAFCWEPIIWASRQEKPRCQRVFGHVGRDFYVVSSHRHERDGHPCQKPLEVMQWLVQLFVPEGGSVLDPYAGSGTTLLAAQELGRDAVGIERSARYVAIAEARLRRQGVLRAASVPVDQGELALARSSA